VYSPVKNTNLRIAVYIWTCYDKVLLLHRKIQKGEREREEKRSNVSR